MILAFRILEISIIAFSSCYVAVYFDKNIDPKIHFPMLLQNNTKSVLTDPLYDETDKHPKNLYFHTLSNIYSNLPNYLKELTVNPLVTLSILVCISLAFYERYVNCSKEKSHETSSKKDKVKIKSNRKQKFNSDDQEETKG